MCLISAARAVRDTVDDLTGYNQKVADRIAAEQGALSAQARAQQEAEAARQAEAQRQAWITQGRSAIDNVFSAFNDDFFDNYARTYQSQYFPEINQQFADSRGKLASSLARTGMSASSTGARLTNQLQTAFDKQRQNVSSSALDAANQLRQQVEQQRSRLYDMNTGAVDPSVLANNARSVASSFQAPPAYSPLGDVFSAAIDPIVAASAAAQNSSKGFNLGTYKSPIAQQPSTIVR